jgi:hypothetical protein
MGIYRICIFVVCDIVALVATSYGQSPAWLGMLLFLFFVLF